MKLEHQVYLLKQSSTNQTKLELSNELISQKQNNHKEES